MPYKHSEPNPYVDAFWEWWDDLYPDMDTFRITGGEPTMSPDFWKVVDTFLQLIIQIQILNYQLTLT